MAFLERNEHLVLALCGLLSIILCCHIGHSDVADAIAFICVGGSGGAAVRSVWGHRNSFGGGEVGEGPVPCGVADNGPDKMPLSGPGPDIH